MPESSEKNTSAKTRNNRIFHFPRGIPGFENIHRFHIEPIAGTPVFFLLQAADEPEVGIIMVDPFPFFPDYSVNILKADQEELLVGESADLLVLTTVTVHDKKFFTNLVAPVLINPKKYLGKQIILPGMEDKDLRVSLNIPSVVATGS